MITVQVSGPGGGGTVTRRAQIVGDAPNPGWYWARTCDGPPAMWLLVQEHHAGTGLPAYTGSEYKAGIEPKETRR